MMSFYDDIAGSYDDMTSAGAREAAADALAARLAERFAPLSVLDAACGTGLHAAALARLGVRVTGSDISPAMLDQARARAADAGVEVRWVQSPMQDLAGCLDDTYDAVLCLGNSLPHLLTDEDLDAAIGGFARLATPGGVVVLHVLNYARILARRERIIRISRQGETEYIRFYDFQDNRVRFNILELSWQGDTCRHTLHSTEHRPWQGDALTSALRRGGVGDIQLYGDMQFAAFDETASHALVVVGRKPAEDAR